MSNQKKFIPQKPNENDHPVEEKVAKGLKIGAGIAGAFVVIVKAAPKAIKAIVKAVTKQ